jgi:hypothetical protein
MSSQDTEAGQQASVSPRPGWYPNPKGEGERYWDGTHWTSFVQEGEVLVRLVSTKDGEVDRLSFENIWVYPERPIERKIEVPGAMRAARVTAELRDGEVVLQPKKGDLTVNEEPVTGEAVLSHGDIVTLKKGALSEPGIFTFQRDLARVKRERQEREDAAGVQRLEAEPSVGQYTFDDQRIGLPGEGYIPWSRIDRIMIGATTPTKVGEPGVVGGFVAGAERARELMAIQEEDRRLFESTSTPSLTGSTYEIIARSHDSELFKLKGIDNPVAVDWVAAIERYAPIDLVTLVLVV